MKKALSKKAKILWSVFGSVVGILLILIIILLSGTTAPYAYAEKKSFSEWEKCRVEKDADGYWNIYKPADRALKILQITDVHIGAGIFCIGRDKLAIDAVSELVERAKPDLIICTGDMTWPIPYSSGTVNNMQSAKAFARLMENTGVPWTVTFGNHDQETFATHKQEKIAEFYEGCKNSLFLRGDKNISGVGNNVIKIKNGDESLAGAIFTLDSHSYAGGFFEYDNIHRDQVEWYEQEVLKLKEQNGGVTLPSVAFFHIPLNAYQDAWRLYEQDKNTPEVTFHFGAVEEEGAILSVPVERSGFFEKAVELGSTKGTFCGHDHLNYFSLTYKGIRLTYGMSIDYTAYVKAEQTNQRGGTVIEIGGDEWLKVSQEKLLKE